MKDIELLAASNCKSLTDMDYGHKLVKVSLQGEFGNYSKLLLITTPKKILEKIYQCQAGNMHIKEKVVAHFAKRIAKWKCENIYEEKIINIEVVNTLKYYL